MRTPEKLLFVENTFSQQLVLFYIAGNTLFTILYVNSMDVDTQLGLFVMVNIALSLIAFLMAVRQKLYAQSWGYVGLAFALFQLVRAWWIPAEITGTMRGFLVLLLLLSSLSVLLGSILCIRRSRERQKFIIETNVDLVTLQR